MANSSNSNEDRVSEYNEMGYNSPSFSNASDVSNIKSTIDKSRAQQVSSGRGVANPDEDKDATSNSRGSELGDKDSLEKKDQVEDKDKLEKAKEEVKKDVKKEESKKLPTKEAIKDKISNINPLNKLKAKFSILKIKIYLYAGALLLGLFGLLLLVGIFSSVFGGAGKSEDSYHSDDDIIKDTYNSEYGKEPSYCIGEDCYYDDDSGGSGYDTTDYTEYDFGDSENKAVNVALNEYRIWSSADNSKKCDMIKKYLNACGGVYYLDEYCAGFVTYALKQANLFSKLGLKTGYSCNVGNFEPYNMSGGVTHPGDGSYVPRPGDLAIYNINGDYAHIELVEKADSSTVYLIGGNTGDYRSACGFREVRRKSKPLRNGSISHYISY